MDSIEAAAATIDEAVDEALRQLGASRNEVQIEVLENPSRGLLGLVGGRQARVRVSRSVATSAPPSAIGSAKAAENESLDAPERDTPPAHLDGDDVDSPTPNAAVVDPALAGERAAQILRDIVTRVGVDATVTIGTHDEGIQLNLDGDTSGVLIGRHGQMLDALEYMVNRILLHQSPGAPRVIVDANEYRSRRRASLEEMALRMADQAKRKGKPVTLSPMPPQDRRIIHLALQGDPSLTTRSSGDGVLRRLVIIPQAAGRRQHDLD